MAFTNRLVSDSTSAGRSIELAPQWREELLGRRDELCGSSFRDATVGICALMAAADGSIDPNERHRAAQLLGADLLLQHFPADELRNLFEDNCARLSMDPAFGRAYVMQQIAKSTGNPAEARAVVQIAIMLSNTEGRFDTHEIAAVREACQVLHLNPSEFGL
ncbi:TerB family tellurite resistance protein [Nocardia sp. NPDC051030]|uniref:tellurite resistance TerB family protein n=1 Tax=Nocardia sp. NPDC051030 TaxID=3155162 RepID=UPI003419D065